MKISLKTLGVLQEASFSLGELTIICGKNNTGKTYATYALFGFLSTWRETISIQIPERFLETLLSEGSVSIDINEFIKDTASILRKGCENYTKKIPEIFAAPSDRFTGSEFFVTLSQDDYQHNVQFERRMKAAEADIFLLTKKYDSNELVITLLAEKGQLKVPHNVIIQIISDAIKEIIFGKSFPKPFIASAERTGAAIFRKELNFARNRLLEEISQNDRKIKPLEILTKNYQDYPLPVKTNVDFTRDLETIAKDKSFLCEKHADILDDFADIIGGEYMVTRADELYFAPRGKKIKLPMDESSSAVRSLLDIGFYLRHVAKLGDLLMIDEPELNLHPENQRRMARLFARLVNAGVKVFITTHSDYIIKELNTLIMLKGKKPHLKDICSRWKYKSAELLTAEKVKVFIAEEALLKREGKTRNSRVQTLTQADVNQEQGIEARSFDATIEDMNQIQDEIIWGGEE
ncbi:MAG: AAA family ATPase [Candidatus Riflebacteria bacterium]|nr:AAA family ATPase [Candidatus Riflebacteria bacterium]